MYGNFAGRDASRGMAKQSFDEGGSVLGLLSSILIEGDRYVDCDWRTAGYVE